MAVRIRHFQLHTHIGRDESEAKKESELTNITPASLFSSCLTHFNNQKEQRVWMDVGIFKAHTAVELLWIILLLRTARCTILTMGIFAFEGQ